MTVLGKILVFVNLAFSLVTAWFIAMVFVTRTNWHTQYERRLAELQQAQTEAATYKAQVDQVKQEDARQIQALTTENENYKTELANARTDNANRFTAITQKDTTLGAAGVTATKATEETARLRSEVQKLQVEIADRDKKVGEMEARVKELTERKTLAEIAADSQQQRNKQLLDQVVTLTQEVDKARTRGGATTSSSGYLTEGATQRPVPADLKARVLDVDSRSGLITISAGSDSGLGKGHQLEIYRLQPKPEYLGKVQIIAAQAHEAVGRPISGLRATSIKRGDEVASNILGPR